jgi:septal ring factor EnvC (AmiA/AmiB activator)
MNARRRLAAVAAGIAAAVGLAASPAAWVSANPLADGPAGTAAQAPPPTRTQSGPPGPDAAEQEKRLARIKGDIQRLRSKIADEDKREKTALSELDRIGFSKRLIRSELSLLQMQLDKLKIEHEGIRKSIPDLEADLALRRDELARVLSTLYKYGRLSLARPALAARNAVSFLAESQALARLASAQDRRIAEYARTLAELGAADKRLQAKEAEIGTLIRTTDGKRRDFEAEEKKGRDVVAQITTNRKTYEQTLAELNVRARALEDLIRNLDARAKPDLPPSLPAVPFASLKGQLPWPVEGRVILGFGPQRGSFETVTQNNGVEIAPPKDDLTIKAVHGGKVVYADHFPGYGNLIILDHGDTYYTLYGHCAEFLARKEEIVRADDPIAVAGDTGSLVGVSLYLEVRYRTKPLNPLQWLSRR